MNSGVLAVISAAIIFGSAGIFVKTLDMPATVIASFRFFIPAIILLVLYKEVRRNLFTKPDKLLIAASCLTALRILLWVLGFLFAPVSKAVVILYTWPLFLTLFSSVFLKETVSRRNWQLLFTAFGGVLVICFEDLSLTPPDYLLGLVLMLGVAILYAIVLTMFKERLENHSPEEVLLYDNFFGALIFLPFLVWHIPEMGATDFGYGAFYGLVIGFLGYYLLYQGLSKVKASLAGILSYFEVVSATILGILFFNESISLQMLVGFGLVLIPSLLLRTRQRK